MTQDAIIKSVYWTPKVFVKSTLQKFNLRFKITRNPFGWLPALVVDITVLARLSSGISSIRQDGPFLSWRHSRPTLTLSRSDVLLSWNISHFKLQARAAGYLEGWVTRDLVRMQHSNTIVGRCDGKEDLCQRIQDWVGQNTLWVRGKINTLRRKEEYWHQAGLFYDQMLGLYSGYKASLEKPEEDPVTMEDIFTMNIFGDLEDLEQVFDTGAKEPAKARGVGHCSALIRLLPGNGDM